MTTTRTQSAKTPARSFDPEKATSTLPLVRRIVADLQDDSDRLQEILPRLKHARSTARRLSAVIPELEPLRLRVAQITTRFEGYLDELSRVGCVYRGTSGHVDFRGEYEGRPVFFCWSPEEQSVTHVHALGLDCRYRESVEMDAFLPLP
jgi:hypothetical protein